MSVVVSSLATTSGSRSSTPQQGYKSQSWRGEPTRGKRPAEVQNKGCDNSKTHQNENTPVCNIKHFLRLCGEREDKKLAYQYASATL